MTNWQCAVAAAVLVNASVSLTIVAAVRALVGHGPVDPGLFLAAYLPAAALSHIILVMGWLWTPAPVALARRVLAAALAVSCAMAALYGAATILGYALRAFEAALGYKTGGREPVGWLSTLWLGGSILMAAGVFGLGDFWGDRWDAAKPHRVRLWRHMAGSAIGFGIVLAAVWGSSTFEGTWVGPLLTTWWTTLLLTPAVFATALAPGQALVAAVPGRIWPNRSVMVRRAVQCFGVTASLALLFLAVAAVRS